MQHEVGSSYVSHVIPTYSIKICMHKSCRHVTIRFYLVKSCRSYARHQGKRRDQASAAGQHNLAEESADDAVGLNERAFERGNAKGCAARCRNCGGESVCESRGCDARTSI